MFKRFRDDMKKYWKYAVYSSKAQLKSEIANSYLNWLWWVLDPICFMLIYTLIFGVVFNAKEQYFTVFIFIGLTMWDFFNKTLQQSVKIVKNNKSIVAKVYLPKYILVMVRMFVNGFKMLISFGIVIIMMVIYRVPVSFNILYLIPIMLTLFLFTFGCSTIVAHFGVFVQDLSNVINIVLRLMNDSTGVSDENAVLHFKVCYIGVPNPVIVIRTVKSVFKKNSSVRTDRRNRDSRNHDQADQN